MFIDKRPVTEKSQPLELNDSSPTLWYIHLVKHSPVFRLRCRMISVSF